MISRSGFTLIEILIVLTILVIIGGAVAVNFVGQGEEAKRQVAKTQMFGFRDALQLYQLQVQQLPNNLEALVEKPSGLSDESLWKGPYLRGKLPNDPWGNPYEFKASGVTYEISSRGPDGQAGNDDDVTVKSE
jgi:general secretion pathway protein G